MISDRDFVEEVEEETLSEVEEILLETDVNSITPMQALTLLAGLKEKVTKSWKELTF